MQMFCTEKQNRRKTICTEKRNRRKYSATKEKIVANRLRRFYTIIRGEMG